MTTNSLGLNDDVLFTDTSMFDSSSLMFLDADMEPDMPTLPHVHTPRVSEYDAMISPKDSPCSMDYGSSSSEEGNGNKKRNLHESDADIAASTKRKTYRADIDTSGMTEEESKIAKRRVRNAQAARACRERKKQKTSKVEKMLEDSRESNTALAAENVRLKTENKMFREQIEAFKSMLMSAMSSTSDTPFPPSFYKGTMARDSPHSSSLASTKTATLFAVVFSFAFFFPAGNVSLDAPQVQAGYDGGVSMSSRVLLSNTTLHPNVPSASTPETHTSWMPFLVLAMALASICVVIKRIYRKKTL